MKRLFAATLMLSLVAGCGTITDIRRNLQTIETDKVPVEGTDEANRLHDQLRTRPSSNAAEQRVLELMHAASTALAPQVGQPVFRDPSDGVRTAACTSPYGGLKNVHLTDLTTMWETNTVLDNAAQQSIWQSLKASWQQHGLIADSTSDVLHRLNEGKHAPEAQFETQTAIYTTERSTRVTITVSSGCLPN
ncbi:hypothetical protein [Tsukamurella pseudospumae]|uniref:Lipoprotein n=1 Tax=Tsukamurella pseudospumae TaxID=239498 RepID=A0A137ZIZ6_9ACTN|nr:hypothetical protein [Tsukamurella pseudospumae]KXO98161.1 hypothetical protein AXK61_19140 [Tsukamurella pseudospumae]